MKAMLRVVALLGLAAAVPDHWTVDDVHAFVGGVGSSPRWGNMADILREHEVDGPLFQEVNEADLTDLGIAGFYARRLLKARAAQVEHHVPSRRRLQPVDTMQNQCLVSSMIELQELLEGSRGEILALNQWRSDTDQRIVDELKEVDERLQILEGIKPTRPPLPGGAKDVVGWSWDPKHNCAGTLIIEQGLRVTRQPNSHLPGEENMTATITHLSVGALGTLAMPAFTGSYSWILEIGPQHWMTLGITAVLPTCLGNTYCPPGATLFTTDSTTNCFNGKWTARNVADVSLPESCFADPDANDRVLFTLDTDAHLFSIKSLGAGGEAVDDGILAGPRLHCTVSVGSATFYPWVHLHNPANFATITCEGPACGDALLEYDRITAVPTKTPTPAPPCLHDWCWDTATMCDRYMKVDQDGLTALWATPLPGDVTLSHAGRAVYGNVAFPPYTGVYTWRIEIGPKHWMVIGVATDNIKTCNGNTYCRQGTSAFTTDTTTICVNGKWLPTNALPPEYQGACQEGLEQGDSALLTLDTDNHTLTVKGERGAMAHLNDVLVDCVFQLGSGTYYPFVHLHNSIDYTVVTCQGADC